MAACCRKTAPPLAKKQAEQWVPGTAPEDDKWGVRKPYRADIMPKAWQQRRSFAMAIQLREFPIKTLEISPPEHQIR